MIALNFFTNFLLPHTTSQLPVADAYTMWLMLAHTQDLRQWRECKDRFILLVIL